MSKICMITTSYPGVNNNQHDVAICHYFTREWVKQGHEVVVYVVRSKFPRVYYTLLNMAPALREKITQGSDVQDRITKPEVYNLDNVEVCSLPITKYIPHGRYPQSELAKTTNYIKKDLLKRNFVPDAIVGHWVNPSIHIISELKEAFPSARTSITTHSGSYRSMIKATKGCEAMLSRVDYVGFRSPSNKRAFVDSCPFKVKDFYCYSGVSEMFLTEVGDNHSRFTDGPLSSFVFVGRLVSYKYPELVIQALNDIYGNENFHLNFYGRKTDLYEKLLEQASGMNLNSKVEFKGAVNRNEMPAALDNEQCLIMISKGEVFGMVYIEAMARGCIVIAGADSGVQEIIKHGENGFLCEPGNLEELKSIIRHINSLSAVEKKKISQNARLTAESLSDSSIADAYIQTVLG